MLQTAELLFSVSKVNQGSYSTNKTAKKGISSSEYSFEEVLDNTTKKQESSQGKVEQTAQKGRREELLFNSSYRRCSVKGENAEDKAEIMDSTSSITDDEFKMISEEAIMEWLISLLTGQKANNNFFTADSLAESLKIIAPSIKNVMEQQSMMSSSVMKTIQAAFMQLLTQELNSEILLTGSLLSNDLNTDGLWDTSQTEIAEALSFDTDTQYDSAIKWILNEISKHTDVQPKEILSSMQMAGLGKQAVLYSADSDKAVDAAGEYGEIKELGKVQNANLNISTEVSVEQEDAEGVEEHQNQDLNALEDKALSSDGMDSIPIESLKAGSSEVIDFTGILDEANPVGSIEVIRDLAEKVSINLKDNRYEMELHIKPENLGKLILKVTLEDGILSGRIYTTNEQTREILQSNLENLRIALEEQGYTFSQLDVNVGNQDSQGQFQYPDRERRDIGTSSLFANFLDETAEKEEEAGYNREKLSSIDYFA